MTLADAVLAALAAPVLCSVGYLTVLTALSGSSPAPAPGAAGQRFYVVVPAHDEATGIADTLLSLRRLDYPPELYRVLVIADNCTDRTADIARGMGVRVLVRDDTARRGKGYALVYAFQRILDEAWADAVVVVDADTSVSINLLRSFAARLAGGARAVQADYAIRNAEASWRTELMSIAFGAMHALRSLARERLRVSCGLRGNGMCFSTSVLAAVPYDAFSIVEDLEYSIRLGLAGVRVVYAHETHVYGEMPVGERDSRTQRRRWEAGRAGMVRVQARRLLAHAVAARDRIALDLATDLLVPPLATIALATAAGLGLSAALSWQAGHISPAGAPWVACAVGLVMYVMRGWQLSETGMRGLRSLLLAPVYIGWKLVLLLRPGAQPRGSWVRTAREGEDRP